MPLQSWQWCLNSYCLEYCSSNDTVLQLASAALNLGLLHPELPTTGSSERSNRSASAILDFSSFVHWVDTAFPCLEWGQGCFCLTLSVVSRQQHRQEWAWSTGWTRSIKRSNCGPQIIHEPLERKYWKSEVLSRNMVCEIPFWFYINVANLWPKGITHLHPSVCI